MRFQSTETDWIVIRTVEIRFFWNHIACCHFEPENHCSLSLTILDAYKWQERQQNQHLHPKHRKQEKAIYATRETTIPKPAFPWGLLLLYVLWMSRCRCSDPVEDICCIHQSATYGVTWRQVHRLFSEQMGCKIFMCVVMPTPGVSRKFLENLQLQILPLSTYWPPSAWLNSFLRLKSTEVIDFCQELSQTLWASESLFERISETLRALPCSLVRLHQSAGLLLLQSEPEEGSSSFPKLNKPPRWMLMVWSHQNMITAKSREGFLRSTNWRPGILSRKITTGSQNYRVGPLGKKTNIIVWRRETPTPRLY